jgi:hypothetical protein
MAWASGFEHDVFLSYARVDNATVENDSDRGWVAQFHKHLEVALSKKVGRLNTVRIWRDVRELPGNKLFDQTIKDAIRASAVFVALSSNGYLQSDYCRQELAWFHDNAQSPGLGLAVGDDYRIFNVLLNNIPRPEWPSEYGRTTGFPLNDLPDGSGEGEPTPFTSELFRSQLRALTDAIHQTLDAIRDQRDAAPDAPADETDAAKKFTIFLADTSDTLAGIRKRIVNELKQNPDIQLAAPAPPPFETAAHNQKVRALLEETDLSVHLLDAFPGREIADDEGSYYPQRQIELALEHGRSQLIWVPQTLVLDSIEDEKHRAFLKGLENGTRKRAYDFQRELPSSITRQILAKVETLRSQMKPADAPAPDATLLDTHIKDQLHAFELGKYLLSRQVQPYIVPQEDDPARTENLFSESLKKAAILIVIYGAVTVEWVRARLAHALQIALTTEGCRLRACGVYIAPPQKPDDADQFTIPAVPVHWMDHTSGFNAAAIDQLLQRGRAAGGGRL